MTSEKHKTEGKRNSDPTRRTLPLLGNENHKLQTRRLSDLKIKPKSKLPRLPSKSTSSTLITSSKEKNLVNLPPLNLPAPSPDGGVFDASSTSMHRRKSLREKQESEEPSRIAADYNTLVSKLEKAIIEWKRSYSKRILQVIVTWLRLQLDQLRFSIVLPTNMKSAGTQQLTALFQLRASCQVNANPTIEITPSLDEIQELLHSAGRIMLCVAKGHIHIAYKSI